MFDNHNEDLATLWGETEAAERKGFDNIPDGKYEAVVHTVRQDKTKTGKPMIAWDLIITNNGQEGRHIFNNQVIETVNQISFVKSQLIALGVDVTSIQSTQAGLENLLDATLAIQVKTKPATADYEARQNIYLNKVVAYGTKNSFSSFPDEELPF